MIRLEKPQKLERDKTRVAITPIAGQTGH